MISPQITLTRVVPNHLWFNNKKSPVFANASLLMKPKQLLSIALFIGSLAMPTIGHSQTGNQNSAASAAGTQPVANKSSAAIDAQVEALLRQMTVEEKIGQMTQLTMSVFTDNTRKELVLKPEELRKAILKYHVGSILNNAQDHAQTVAEWHTIINTIQDIATKERRLKVPVLYGVDAIHGATYISNSFLFPQQIGIGCSRDLDYARQMGSLTAVSTRGSGVRWNFAPVLDVARSPLWSRFPETFGESTHLCQTMGVANIIAAQGADLASPNSVAACMKHFLGYSATNSGKDRTTASIPERDLREVFLPPFRAAIKAGARTVMINSGDINGIPVHANPRILTDLLRNELGFDGLAVTDWEDIIKLHTRHHVAPTLKEAVLMAINAGVDMSMVPYDYNFCTLLAELVKEGKVSEARLDLSVRRILKLKVELGLMTNPYPEKGIEIYPKATETACLNAARESLVLLKNNNATLPLATGKKVLVVGPTADYLPSLHGSWSYTWQGTDTKQYPASVQSILAALKSKHGAQNVNYLQGVDLKGETKTPTATLLSEAQKADVIVVCLGEDGYAEIPGNIDDLSLPTGQLDLVKRLSDARKPMVIVLAEGRPRVFTSVEPLAQAVVLAPQPGTFGGIAIAELLTGTLNPSGKLSFTYPRHVNDLLTHNSRVGDIMPESNSLTPPNKPLYNPLYAFGHGLSYSSFKYSPLTLSRATMKAKGDSVTLTIKVTNTSNREAKHALDLMVSDVYASVIPAYMQHKQFQKRTLKAGESADYVFVIRSEDLAMVDINNQTVVEPGQFMLRIGEQQVRLDVY